MLITLQIYRFIFNLQKLYNRFFFYNTLTVSPILIYFKITDRLNNIITENFIPSIGKFQEYQINADLLINIQSQISQIVFIGFLYLFLQIYPRIVNKYFFTFRNIYFVQQANSQWFSWLIIKLYQINKKILNLRTIYSKKGFIQLFYANCWDLLFKVFLFMTSNTETGYRSTISYSICFLVLGLTIIILLLNIKGLNDNLKVSKIRFEQLEGITLLKKLLFILILIDQQSSDIIQCTMLTLLSLGYIGFLSTIKIYWNNLDGGSSNALYNKISSLNNTLTSLIYCSDFLSFMKYNEQILVGFVQIVILVLGLLGPVIKLGINVYKEIKQFYQQKKYNPVFVLNIANILTIAQENRKNVQQQQKI